MAKLFGKQYTRRQICERFGSLEQVAGITSFQYNSGRSGGIEAAEIRSGDGLRYVVMPGRGMDIGYAEYKGIPLTFRSSVGECSSVFYDPVGSGWLRSFAGGLLVTCGLTYLGNPEIDNGEVLGQHGRISNLPANEVGVQTVWTGDECEFSVRGKVRESKAHDGPNVTLERKITTPLGENRIIITDVVTNDGCHTVPHMQLYHINVGYPLLDKNSRFLVGADSITAWSQSRQNALELYDKFDVPTPDYPDVCYYIDPKADKNNQCKAAVINEALGLGLYVKFDKTHLPNLVHWKYLRSGDYVCSMEPSNCHIDGRVAERSNGTLKCIEPGEEKQIHMELGVLTSLEDICAFAGGQI